MKYITLPIVLVIGLIMIGCSSVQVPVTPEKAPLPLEDRRASTETMEKWNDWKFGLFVHWGPWSQTEIGAIWKIVKTDTPEEREERFELYKTFDPVNFNPQEWAQVAKDAGMKYMVFTTKHHDGFCNFETAVTKLQIQIAHTVDRRIQTLLGSWSRLFALRAWELAITIHISIGTTLRANIFQNVTGSTMSPELTLNQSPGRNSSDLRKLRCRN
jgi:hypothetical protein